MFFAVDVAPWEPGDWPKAYATSPYMSTNSWVFFRFLVLLFFVGHFVAHLVTYWPGEQFTYFIYLSRWTIACEVVQECIYFLLAFWGSVLVENGLKTPTLPVLVKIHMALKCMVLPTCLLSSGLYWAFSPFLPPPYISAAVHGGDVIVIHLSFFLGRFPYAFNKCGYILLWAGSYSIFTVLHFLLKIGTDDSAPCAEYPLNECPVYADIDWHHPKHTALLAFGGALVATPLLGGLYTGLTMLRDRCDNSAKVMREATLVPREESVKLQSDTFRSDQLKWETKTPLNCGV
mmetsp:Transcript_19686/g.41126  ORF Transcript_19686/g.41126 Transcript_19686/m.41126 type:complete len:289 (+) Transcript_19686:91-957(+)